MVDDSRARDVRTFAMVMMSASSSQKNKKMEVARQIGETVGDGDGRWEKLGSSLPLLRIDSSVHSSEKLVLLPWLLSMIYRG